MRSVLSFAVLAVLLISTHAWKPSWEEFRKNARKHMEQAQSHMSALREHLPKNLQSMMDQAMKKLNEHHANKDIQNAMEKMHQDIMSKWRNVAATHGMHIRDPKALENLMKHMMLAQAQHNMQMSHLMEIYAHKLATVMKGDKSSPEKIKALSSALSNLGHNHMRKFMVGVEDILRKNSVSVNHDQLRQALQRTCAALTHGHGDMASLMAEMKKLGVHTDGLDENVKKELAAHFEKMRNEGSVELKKIMTAHKVGMNMDQALAAMKIKAMEMMTKMKAMHGSPSKKMMEKLHELAKKAFKNMKSVDHKKLMAHLQLVIRPALSNHYHMIAHIYKKNNKNNMEVNHSVIHYIIYHRIKQQIKIEDDDDDDDHHHHHHGRFNWFHKKGVKLAIIIGGSVFGLAVIVALIIVVVNMLKEKRRTPPPCKKVDGEKCSLPYSIMDEKDASRA